MAGGDNIEGGKQVVSALHSIPFGNIIGGPLAACVHAQAEASQTTLNFIRGFTMADSGIDVDGAEPVTVTFSFVMNGVPTLMTLPLMTLVPIPYMRIEHVNLSFTADITACSNEKMEARYASEGYKRTEESEKSVSVQSKMGIHVRATTSDMPSGMARMLDFFANNLIIQETLTAQEVSDMRLEAARQRAIRRNDEAEKARIEAQQAQEKARREAQEKARREEQEKRQLHRQIALLIRDLKYKKETEEASAPQDQSAGSTSSATPGRVYPNGKGSFMGASGGSSSTGSSTSTGTPGRVYPNGKGSFMGDSSGSSSTGSSTSTGSSSRVYPNGKGSFMGASGGSSSTGSSTSTVSSGRVYPNGKGSYMGASSGSSSTGSTSSATSGRVYPNGKGSFMGASSGSSSTGSSTSSGTSGRVYPNRRGTILDTPNDSSSSSTPTRAYPSGKGAFMDSSSTSSTSPGSSSATGSSSSSSTPTRAYPSGKGAFMDSSNSSSTTGSSSSGTSSGSSTVGSSLSSSTPTRAYPKGKGAYLGASARSYLAGMGAAAASKAGSDDKDAKPTEPQQTDAQQVQAKKLVEQMRLQGKKIMVGRNVRRKK